MSSLSTGTLSEPAVRVVDEAGGGTDPASLSSGASCVSMVSNAAGRRASVMGTTGVSMLLVDVVSLPRRLGQPRRSSSSMNLKRASAIACWLTSPARAMIASSRSPTSGGCAIAPQRAGSTPTTTSVRRWSCERLSTTTTARTTGSSCSTPPDRGSRACQVSSRACCARSSSGAHDRGWDGTWRIRKPSSRVVPPAITEPLPGS